YDPEQYLRHLQGGCRKALRRLIADRGQIAERRSADSRFEGGRSKDVSQHRNPQSAIERPFYVAVEKILAGEEPLRESWAAHGTTGYGFLNLLNGLFVDSQNAEAFSKLYRRLAGVKSDFAGVAYESKKLILETAMSSELHMLSRRLDRISEQ